MTWLPLQARSKAMVVSTTKPVSRTCSEPSGLHAQPLERADDGHHQSGGDHYARGAIPDGLSLMARPKGTSVGGSYYLCIDPSKFGPIAEVKAKSDRFAQGHSKSTKPLPGGSRLPHAGRSGLSEPELECRGGGCLGEPLGAVLQDSGWTPWLDGRKSARGLGSPEIITTFQQVRRIQNMSNTLEGKVAIVTGATKSKGLGKAIAVSSPS